MDEGRQKAQLAKSINSGCPVKSGAGTKHDNYFFMIETCLFMFIIVVCSLIHYTTNLTHFSNGNKL